MLERPSGETNNEVKTCWGAGHLVEIMAHGDGGRFVHTLV